MSELERLIEAVNDPGTSTQRRAQPGLTRTPEARPLSLSSVRSLAVDRAGNVFATDVVGWHDVPMSVDRSTIARTFEHRLVLIPATGPATVFAAPRPAVLHEAARGENHTVSPIVLAVSRAGWVYVADPANHDIWWARVTFGEFSNSQFAASRDFSLIGAIAADESENVYIADRNRLTKLNADGRVMWVIGGGIRRVGDDASLAIYLNYPSGLAVDRSGAVYVADTFSHRVLKVIQVDGRPVSVTTLAGAGEPGLIDTNGEEAQFKYPRGLALAPDGGVYVADSGNGRIRVIDINGNVSSLLFSAVELLPHRVVSGTTRLNRPVSVAVDDGGRIYVADTQAAVMRLIP